MQLYYLKDPVGNFGDDLNGWLWPRLIPEHLFVGDDTLFIGIGTILDRRIPKGPFKIVFGSGCGYAPLPLIDDRYEIYFVRGPRTAASIGLPREKWITDPAILLDGSMFEAQGRSGDTAFIPHHGSMMRAHAQGCDLGEICESVGLRLIDPTGPIEQVLADLCTAKLVIAEAMHGAIIADAFRIPWVPIKLYGHTLDFKWLDWTESLELAYEPTALTFTPTDSPSACIAQFLHRQATTHNRFLSKDAVINKARRMLDEALSRLRENLTLRSLEYTRGGADLLGPMPREIPSVGHSLMSPNEYRSWWESLQLASQEIASTIGVAEPFILIDDGAFGGELRARYAAMPLVERHGTDWGPPANGAHALGELLRQKRQGARYAVFFRTSFWWLDHFGEMRSYLRQMADLVIATDNVIIYRL